MSMTQSTLGSFEVIFLHGAIGNSPVEPGILPLLQLLLGLEDFIFAGPDRSLPELLLLDQIIQGSANGQIDGGQTVFGILAKLAYLRVQIADFLNRSDVGGLNHEELG